MIEPTIQTDSTISYELPLNTFSYRVWKRLFDLIFAAMFLVIYLPLWLGIALLIKMNSPGPILFRQGRIGVGGRPFQLYKFRTMYVDAADRINKVDPAMEGAIFKVRNDPRITPVGKFLRKTSLDEIPQFLNILKGDMSLVGPRPAFKYELSNVNKKELNCRLSGRPGMTGLWAVTQRRYFDVSEMVEIDNDYLREWSLWLDFKILYRTMAIVLFRPGKGAY